MNCVDLKRKKGRVVVIDSGIKKTHPCFKNTKICGIGIKCKDGMEYEVTEKFDDEIGHGTAVCGILSKSVFVKEIYIIKIYGKELNADIDMLIFALKYIKKNIACEIINMSLGINTYSQELEQVCKDLHNDGVVLVSAYDNMGGISFPAAFDNVIGVDTSIECIKTNDYIYVENSCINLLAKGGNHRLAWTEPLYIINQGSSFSCAYVCSAVMDFLNSGYEPKQILTQLRKNAKKVYYARIPETEQMKIQMQEVAVIPVNKETHSLFNFEELLDFNVQGYYDIPQRILSKATLGIEQRRKIDIKSYLQIDWFGIDTLIIGHLHEISIYANKNLKRYLLDQCLKFHINAYCFDMKEVSEYKERFRENNLQLYVPVKTEREMVSKAGKLYSISVPVLGVFGTSTKQGKFTLQLYLRKNFLEKGYRVGQIGTEPTAPLFGMDDCFSFGYDSTVLSKGKDTIELINNSMFNISKKDIDIIITGSQSGTVPRLCNNIEQLHVEQLEFLLGTNPDIIVLCVNIFDELDYIERTILTLERIIDAKVIALALSPLVFPNNWEIMGGEKVVERKEKVETYKSVLTNRFNRPTFIIGDNIDMQALVERCINVLSQ